LGKGGNKSRQQDGTNNLNPKTFNLGFFSPLWDDDNGEDGKNKANRL